MKSLILALAFAAACAVPASAQRVTPHTLDDVLETTGVRSVLADMPDQFLAVYAQARPAAVVPDEVGRLAAVHFADSTLYRYVLEEMQERATGEVVPALTAWLFSDWAMETHDAVKAAEPHESLEEYAAGLQVHPPRPERVRLVARFVRANEAGPFYLGLEKAQRDAVRRVARALGDDARTALPEPTAEEDAEALENSSLVTLVSFLQRNAPLSDEQMERLVSAYESESGRWYVRSYSESLAEAIRRAGLTMASAL